MKNSILVLALTLTTALAHASTDRILDGQKITNGAALLTLPTSTDTLVGRATSDTLTNKTISGASNTLSNIGDGSLSVSYLKADGTRELTANWGAGAFSITANSVQLGSAANTISGLSTIVNTGTLTLPTSSDTLVGRATSDTLTNKTISGSSNTLSNIADGSLSVSYIKADGTRAFTGDQSMGTHKLTNLATPSAGTDAATKAYVDAASPAPSVTGTRGAPSAITAVGGIAFTGTNYTNYWFIAGSGGAVTVTATPQIAAGTNPGQVLTLIGRSATNTVTLSDGNGLSLNGAWVGGLDSVLTLVFDGTNWVEMSRR